MTTCIAAKCREGVIFGAAERMKTADDIQFEPSTSKIISLTSSIYHFMSLTSRDKLLLIFQAACYCNHFCRM